MNNKFNQFYFLYCQEKYDYKYRKDYSIEAVKVLSEKNQNVSYDSSINKTLIPYKPSVHKSLDVKLSFYDANI